MECEEASSVALVEEGLEREGVEGSASGSGSGPRSIVSRESSRNDVGLGADL